ncbi:MAG TPA: alcohol dehydrogenase catalytic domain-containing protein [Ktedonobacterales bacterium]|jgi:threonine dehydrogenase-like Zn-dependent dehydrogenase
MRVLEVQAPGQFGFQERPEPTPGAGEVLLCPLAVGICGSDREIVLGTRPEPFVRYPIVPGHEWTAEVLALGPGVQHLVLGEYVAVEGINYCRVCAACRQGRTNLCAHYDEFGFTRDGGLAERVVACADLLHPFRHTLAPQYAALSEPAACALHGVEMVAPQPGETVVVIGPGTIGLLGVAFFALHHPRRLIVVGRSARNRDLALALGATDFLTGSPEQIKGLVQELTGGAGADVVYEAAGHAAGVPLALSLARRGGRLALEGIAGGGAQFSLDSDLFILQALEVKGIFSYTSSHFERALRLIEGGLLNVAPLVTHQLPLSRYSDGLALLESRTEPIVKVAILPQA